MRRLLLLTSLLTSTISHAGYYVGVDSAGHTLGYVTNSSDNSYYIASELQCNLLHCNLPCKISILPYDKTSLDNYCLDNLKKYFRFAIDFKYGKQNTQDEAELTPFINFGAEVAGRNKNPRIAINLGCGIRYQINDKFNVNTGWQFSALSIDVSWPANLELNLFDGSKYYITWIYNF